MKLLQRKSKKKGFTLVELMVVIAIIAVLLMIAVPKLSDSTKGAKVRTFEANFRTLMSAANGVYVDSGMKKESVTKEVDSIKTILTNVEDKPAGATYAMDTAGELTATLSKDVSGAAADYVLSFDVETSKVTVTGEDDEKWKTLVSFKD